MQSSLHAGGVIRASDSLYGTGKTGIRFVSHGGPGTDADKEKNRSVFEKSGGPFTSALHALGLMRGSASTAHCDKRRKDAHGICAINSSAV